MEAAATGTCVSVEGVDAVVVDVDVDVAEGVGVPVDVDVDVDVAEGVGVPVDVDVDVAEGVGVPVDVDVDAPAVLEELLVHPANVTLADIAAMPRTWNSAFIIFLLVGGHRLFLRCRGIVGSNRVFDRLKWLPASPRRMVCAPQ
jgi:hypothetical protein